MNEVWLIVPQFNEYEVSSEGRARRATAARGTRVGQTIKSHPRCGGYLYLDFWRAGERTQVRLNRLVCELFNGEPPTPQHHSAHRDGNKLNNRADNLYWATAAENSNDMARHGTRARGTRITKAKLTDEAVLAIRARRGSATQEQLAQEFGVNQVTISRVLLRQSWTHVGEQR